MTVTTDTERTTQSNTTPSRASAFPRRPTEHSPNLATLDMLRSTGRNPLLLTATRRARLTRKRNCGSSDSPSEV